MRGTVMNKIKNYFLQYFKLQRSQRLQLKGNTGIPLFFSHSFQGVNSNAI